MNQTPPASPAPNHVVDLPAWSWLWLPVIYLLLNYVIAGISVELHTKTLGGGEVGITELLTVLLLIVAVFIGLHSLWLTRGHNDWRLKVWLVLGTLGCIYFGGEEASWGQHLIGWESSEAWQEFNDQQETNLHNSEKYGPLLDQLPRNLLTLGILVGGLIAPIWRGIKGIQLNAQGIHYWIWPTKVLIPLAILAVFVTTPEKISKAAGMQLDFLNIRSGEAKELYIAWFLMLYLSSLNLRFRQQAQQA
ncbi:MAG: hypothetical protein R3352_00465 [Salinisphaeraceae bacterium]|nr:hypothetical protein [Salinisphaeraceae bacterium]